jgi:hypothetical protein
VESLAQRRHCALRRLERVAAVARIENALDRRPFLDFGRLRRRDPRLPSAEALRIVRAKLAAEVGGRV